MREFKRVLEEILEKHQCSIINFTYDKNIVIFELDNDEIAFDMLEDLKNVTGVRSVAYGGGDVSSAKIIHMLKGSQNAE